MTTAQHLATLKAHNAWRRGDTLKLDISPKEIGEAIDCAISVMETQANPPPLLQPHIFRELVNDLRDLAKQFHGHDSLRDRISARLAQDVPVVGPRGGHTAQLPDPFGLLSCSHPDCGRYEGPRSHECRAMADNACARPSICQGHAAQQEADEAGGA